MANSVYKVIELVGTSTTSWEDAAKAAGTMSATRDCPTAARRNCSSIATLTSKLSGGVVSKPIMSRYTGDISKHRMTTNLPAPATSA